VTAHRRTDPACVEYRPPRNALETWRHNRARGFPCPVCEPLRKAAAQQAEQARRTAIIEADTNRGARFTAELDDLRRYTG
jgi:hypothetical protein